MYTHTMVQREQYLSTLRKLKDKNLIKVLTGVRRCGKSTLLTMFRDELLTDGVETRQIQTFNFELIDTPELLNWQTLHDTIVASLIPDKQNYLFLDEIQNVVNFEKVLDSLYARPNTDIYITGSNAYFLSSDLATLLSGRQFEIKVLPYSFAEYIEALNDPSINRAEMFAQYLQNGGFPQSVELFNSSENIGVDYLSGIFSTVVLKDIITREKMPNDAEALRNILRFTFDNVGSLLSPKKIADYMASNYRNISNKTVEQFLSASVDSFVLYSADRFDIKGKELLQTQQKYYLVDTGLRRVLLGRDAQFDTGRALENVIYLELLRRGYQVWIGRTKSGKEVDFVARTPSGVLEYYQVTETMIGQETRERELSSLMNIDDHNQKFVITLDPGSNSYNGISQQNAIDWLLADQLK